MASEPKKDMAVDVKEAITFETKQFNDITLGNCDNEEHFETMFSKDGLVKELANPKLLQIESDNLR